MERMERLTAVDFIFHTFYNEDNISDYVLRVFQQAKEMEKEQIMDAHYFGYTDCRSHNMRTEEQYYNQTFKSE
jgi:hypothetical protein